ncbi:Peptidase family M23 [Aliiroseovarius crassostreae]|nr:M23 family metallopeptidase [Aliiroseovarius crassostreae]SFU97998.1 Peptidase family M23 [Aliiroseovarius crassostreae]
MFPKMARIGLIALLPIMVATKGATESCLAVPVMSEAGERIMSPYGVDRSSRPGASSGYHQGLDIVNSAGRGDPIFAGIHGTVFVAKDGSGGKKVGITSTDGTQRFVFFHLDSYSVRVGDTVTPDTQIGIQGSTGVSYSAVHLHLSSLLRGDVLRAHGNTGRVWRTSHGWVGTKGTSPLSASQIEGALPNDYYFVNPETYLHHRIQFNVPAAYQAQGVIRPDNLTLEPTCTPSTEFFDMAAARSSNGGVSSADGIQSEFARQGADEAVAAAVQERKEAIINVAQAAVGDLVSRSNDGVGASHRALGWAGLVAGMTE